MADDKMMAQITERDGFIAALDQSGGSTPGALRLYERVGFAVDNTRTSYRKQLG